MLKRPNPINCVYLCIYTVGQRYSLVQSYTESVAGTCFVSSQRSLQPLCVLLSLKVRQIITTIHTFDSVIHINIYRKTYACISLMSIHLKYR